MLLSFLYYLEFSFHHCAFYTSSNYFYIFNPSCAVKHTFIHTTKDTLGDRSEHTNPVCWAALATGSSLVSLAGT